MYFCQVPPSADRSSGCDELLAGRIPDTAKMSRFGTEFGERMTEIIIDPVTRIEGHSKITIQLDELGKWLTLTFM